MLEKELRDSDEKLFKIVADNIEAALANGYNIDDYTDDELAGDLSAYAEDCEIYSVEYLTAAVHRWRKNRGRTKEAQI
jgi:hypothetical protein